MSTDIINFLMKNISNLNHWTIKPLKLIISFAITHGNPLYEKIPLIMMQASFEYQDELSGHLKYAT